ncbi:MAG: hypothetical protein OHK0046_20400 [Anaerolineae bacterium]
MSYLRKTYGDALLQRDGQTYPVYPFPPGPGDTFETLLVPDAPRAHADPASFPVVDQNHLNALLTSRPHLTNGLSYILHRLTLNPMRLEARLGYYFDMLATCDALDHELRRYGRGESTALPLREQLHQAVPPAHLPLDGAGRAAVIGVAVLTVFNDGGEYRVILGQRSGAVATGANLLHVLPAFVFQPSGQPALATAEWSVIHQIVREFGEEIFGMPEFDAWPGADSATYFYDHPGVADLRAMLADGRAQLEFTGMSWNPLSTRQEICGLLLIHDPAWFQRWQPHIQAALLTERQQTFYLPLDTLAGLPVDLPSRITPQGGAAFWAGVDRARQILR